MVEGVCVGLVWGGCVWMDVFDVFGVVCCVVRGEMFGEEVVVEVATRASSSDAGDDASYVVKGFEVLWFYVL